MYKEIKSRSIVKTICWRFIATTTTIALVLIMTGKLDIAFTVGGFEVILKMLFYFLHERGWDKIRWGKHEIKPFVVWITGLSGSGKTSVAKKVTDELKLLGLKSEHFDGETMRELLPQTGFSKHEVDEHIKRVGLLASRLENVGVFVVASFISPYKDSREFVRKICENYIEVYLSTPIEICESRENNNLYKRARVGEINNLPGIGVKYEEPEQPNLKIDTSHLSINETTNQILEYIKKYL